MKRFLVVIPILLLFLVNSCTGNYASVAAQVATSWTPTPIFTVVPAVADMVKALNSDLSTTSPLGWFMDAQYYVIGVTFSNISNGTEQIAQVNVECTCMNETNCCLPERTVVVIIESMRRNNFQTMQALGSVRELRVACANHQTKDSIGTMAVAWQYVQNYLSDSSRAYELGGQIHHIDVP